VVCSVHVAANKSLVRKTMISAFLEDLGVLEVGSVGESHGVNPFPHSSALTSLWSVDC